MLRSRQPDSRARRIAPWSIPLLIGSSSLKVKLQETAMIKEWFMDPQIQMIISLFYAMSAETGVQRVRLMAYRILLYPALSTPLSNTKKSVILAHL